MNNFTSEILITCENNELDDYENKLKELDTKIIASSTTTDTTCKDSSGSKDSKKNIEKKLKDPNSKIVALENELKEARKLIEVRY
jgi:septal ring factor EnvC (AmiA/AmiB activator)